MTMKPKMAPHDASRPFPLFREKGEKNVSKGYQLVQSCLRSINSFSLNFLLGLAPSSAARGLRWHGRRINGKTRRRKGNGLVTGWRLAGAEWQP
jgi:hypothetical protein